MSARDIRAAHQAALTAGPAGAKILPDVAAGERIIAAGGQTLRPDEVRELLAVFKAESANAGNDGAVRAWLREQVETIEYIGELVPRINARVEAGRPEVDRLFKKMMQEGRATDSLTAETARAAGQAVPPELRAVPEATKKILNAAVKGGATPADARELEPGELSVDHGHLMPRGKVQRYPQWRPLEQIYAISAELQRDGSQAPDQLHRYDGLDPRVTILNGAVADRLVHEKQVFHVEKRSGDAVSLERVERTWAEHALLDGDGDGLDEEYDEAAHPDHLAWDQGDGPFASNAMIWLDGTLHLLRAPRRTYSEDEIGLGGGILTTGSLGRGFPGWFWGHVNGDVREVKKDPNDPTSPTVRAFVITKLGLSGFLCSEIAEGKLKLPDPVALVKAQGLRVADGLQVEFENLEAGRQLWTNPATGLIEKRP